MLMSFLAKRHGSLGRIEVKMLSGMFPPCEVVTEDDPATTYVEMIAGDAVF